MCLYFIGIGKDWTVTFTCFKGSSVHLVSLLCSQEKERGIDVCIYNVDTCVALTYILLVEMEEYNKDSELEVHSFKLCTGDLVLFTVCSFSSVLPANV